MSLQERLLRGYDPATLAVGGRGVDTARVGERLSLGEGGGRGVVSEGGTLSDEGDATAAVGRPPAALVSPTSPEPRHHHHQPSLESVVTHALRQRPAPRVSLAAGERGGSSPSVISNSSSGSNVNGGVSGGGSSSGSAYHYTSDGKGMVSADGVIDVSEATSTATLGDGSCTSPSTAPLLNGPAAAPTATDSLVSLYDSPSAAALGHTATLTVNYRAHPQLLSLPSQLFYSNTLISAAPASIVNACAAFSLLPRMPMLLGRRQRRQWQQGDNIGGGGMEDEEEGEGRVDHGDGLISSFPMLCVGVSGNDQHKVDSQSYWNQEEISATVWLVRYLLR